MFQSEFLVEEHSCPRRDGSAMLLRVARPKGNGPFPAIIDIHGGAWISGDRNQNAAIDDYLAQQGIISVAPEFRMPPEVRYPIPISDVLLAIQWLKANAQNLGSHKTLVGGIGTSSGGHQLLECFLRPRHPPYMSQIDEKADTDLNYLVMCWPVADPLRRFLHAKDKKNQPLLKAHDLYWHSEAEMEAGNPQLVLESGLHNKLVPLLVIQGTSDDNLNEGSSEKFVAAWKQRAGQARLELFDDEPHTFITRSPTAPASMSALSKIASFIHNHSC